MSKNKKQSSEKATVKLSERKTTGQIKGLPKSKGNERYSIVSSLGEGSSGQVFLALDLELNRQIALKELWKGTSNNITNVARFRREAQAIARLRHPNIVTIYDIGLEKDSYYFTMDYVPGETLSAVLQREQKFSPQKTAQIVSKLAKALHCAHKSNIIHRDIKPSNVIIDESLEPYLLDFGLAKEIEGGSRLSRTGIILGTPVYMSPEQGRGEKELDGRADIYSLGATMYEMLTGNLLFSDRHIVKLISKIENQKPIAPHKCCPQIPLVLENICLKALEKDKELRYQNALDMAKELDAFLLGNTHTTKSVSVVKSAPTENKMQSKLMFQFMWVLLGLSALFSIIIALLWYNNSQLEERYLAELKKEKENYKKLQQTNKELQNMSSKRKIPNQENKEFVEKLKVTLMKNKALHKALHKDYQILKKENLALETKLEIYKKLRQRILKKLDQILNQSKRSDIEKFTSDLEELQNILQTLDKK